MSETDEGGTRSKTGGSGGKTLSLKRTETSTVRQSFSHGRSKAVVVEKKRARVMPGPGKGPVEADKPAARHPAAEEIAHPAEEARRAAAANRGGVVLRELTEDEKEARLRALTDAKFAEEEARKHAEEESRRRAIEEDRMRREREAAEKRKAEEEARKQSEDMVRRRAEDGRSWLFVINHTDGLGMVPASGVELITGEPVDGRAVVGPGEFAVIREG